MIDAILKFLSENELAQGGLFLGMAGALMVSLRRLPGRVWSVLLSRLSWTVEIRNDSSLFHWMNIAIQTRAKNSARSWVMSTFHDAEGRCHVETYPAQWVSMFRYAGRRFLMWKDTDTASQTLSPRETLTIRTAKWNRDRLDALVQEAVKIGMPASGTSIVFTYDYLRREWTSHQTVSLRRLRSVILPRGMAERVRDDVQSFLSSREAYEERGMPWHRGYLLHGDPGNGKTSLVAGLAREFEMNLSILHLSGLNDSTLMTALTCLPRRSFLVMEDVDCVVPDRNGGRDDKREKVTLSGLLNAIDGLTTPAGQIVFMTTNQVQDLDPALIRPGRIDVSLEVSAPDEDQRTRLFEQLHGTSDGAIEFARDTAGMSMAAVQERALVTEEKREET